MPIADITEVIFQNSRNTFIMHDVVAWLTANIGEYYGHGLTPAIHVGTGWKITFEDDDLRFTDSRGIRYYIDISDEKLFILFSLLWI